MRAGRGIAAWFVAWSLAASALAAPSMSIKFAEPVALAATPGQVEFDAYGRRFALTLESNDRLLKSMSRKARAGLKPGRVLRGKVNGLPGSWVRLTRVGNGIEGAIWDGHDVYVVSRYAGVAAHLTTPLAAAPEQTVVYRLSDTLNGLPPEFCGLLDEPAPAGKSGTTGLQQYKSLVTDLRSNAATATATGESLTIALLADQAFQSIHGSNSLDMMLARLNVVDGIFTEQVGIVLLPTETRLMPANADPFTTTQPELLLQQLSNYRQQNASVGAAGLAHLVTGKDLDGTILGIGFVDVLCNVTAGVSLSDSEQGEFFSALVMAHEIGHNFGARHDGVPGACESTSQDYLMSPNLNGSTQFSQCSLASMATTIEAARGSCIVPSSYVDLSVAMPDSPYSPITDGTGFSLPITVRSVGSLPATNVRLEVSFPTWVTPQGATIEGAACTFAYPLLSCTLPDFAPGEERLLQLSVTGSSPGGIQLQATVFADGDLVGRNDKGSVSVVLQSGVDLAVSIATNASTVYANDPIDYTIDVVSTSRSTLASHGGKAYISLSGIKIESFDAGPHTCTSKVDALECDLASIAAGASTRITIRARSDMPRISSSSASLYDLPADADPSNNYVYKDVTVLPERYVRVETSAQELRAVIGTPYELTFTLTAIGRLPSENVRFLSANPSQGVLESVTTAGIDCVASQGSTTCNFGTLNPGDVRTVVVRFHMEQRVTTFVAGFVRWTDPVGEQWSSVDTMVVASPEIDVGVGAGAGGGLDEGVVADRYVSVESFGVNPAQDVTVTVQLPLPMRLLELSFISGPAGWTCELLTTQTGRCTGSFSGYSSYPDWSASLRFKYVSDVAGDYLGTITAETSGDGYLGNNTAQTVLRVKPVRDVGVSMSSEPLRLLVGETATLNATITTGKNPVTGAHVNTSVSDAALALDSFVVSGFNCTKYMTVFNCDLGDLPANSAIPATVVVRAVAPDATPYLHISVSSADLDSRSGDNNRAVVVSTFGQSDVRLTVTPDKAVGSLGRRFNVPRVTVTNGAAVVRDITVNIPLPPFATVVEVQGDAMCSGTGTLQCTIAVMGANASRSIDVIMNPNSTGTFTGSASMSVFNDVTPDNNSAAFDVTVNPASTGGAGGGAKSGGGGGRFEWLSLAVLAALMVRKWGHSPFPSKWGQSPFPGKRGRSSTATNSAAGSRRDYPAA